MTRVIDELIEDALRELADEERQRTLWLSSGEPEVSSFAECLSRLWDDSGLAIEMERPGVIYTSEIDDKLRRLDAVLGLIEADKPVEQVLMDPRLIEAREMSKILLEDIRRFGHDAASSS